jgi:hypothetical protein
MRIPEAPEPSDDPTRSAPSGSRRRFALALAALPAACSITGGPRVEPQPVPLPTVRVGDRWRYRQIDRFRNAWVDEPVHEVVAVSPDIRVRITDRRSTAPREERFSSPWSAIVDTSYETPIRFERPMPILPVPIELGESLASETTYRIDGSNSALRWSQTLHAERWERVDVPAGRFDCLRISRVIAYRHPDPFRGNASRSDTIWYAPQVNRWVQREWSGDSVSSGLTGAPAGIRGLEDWVQWQLVSYQPAAPA